MLNIVLVEPEIPQNTGNIARTCAATGCALHLVKPLGFSLDDKYMKRAGLDYWFLAEPCTRELAGFLPGIPQARACFRHHQGQKLCAGGICEGDFLVFGRETRGLPESLPWSTRKRASAFPCGGKRAASTFPIPSPLWRMKRCGNWVFPALPGKATILCPNGAITCRREPNFDFFRLNNRGMGQTGIKWRRSTHK